MAQRSVPLYRGVPHPCNYLPGQTANSIFLDPNIPLTTEIYAQLIEHGFRRSGGVAYRPACPTCDECVPLRLDVPRFTANRNQRRTWKNNHDLTVRVQPAEFRDDYFELYKAYLAARHPDGGMAQQTPDEFRNFLLHCDVDVRFHEFRLHDRLLAVAVVDHLPDALSAVYTFFDPHCAERSLGTYAVLRQIHAAAERGLTWLYLGYWIADCRKMTYKSQFQPAQHFRNNRWTDAPAATIRTQCGLFAACADDQAG